EQVTRLARNDPGGQTMKHDRRLSVRDVHGSRDLVQLLLERGVVDLSRGRDVRAEEAQVEAAKAAQRAEAFPLAAHGVDGGAPVHLNPEVPGLKLPRTRADAEDHRDGGQLRRSLLEG